MKKEEAPLPAPAPEKKRPNYLGYSVEFWVILIVVILAIPFWNLVAMPIILVVGAILLIYILWRQRR